MFSLGYGFRYYQSKKPIEYNEESLTGVDDDIVLFPYEKDFTGPTVFKEFIYEGNASVFVQNYLMYYPGFNEIKNRDISDFNNPSNFVIQNSDKEDVFEEILSNEILRNLLVSGEPNQLVYLEKFDVDANSSYELEFNFECDRELPKSELSLSVYTIDSYDEDLVDEEETIFTFPGCSEQIQEILVDNETDDSEGEEGDEVRLEQPVEVSYRVPFDPFLILNDRVLFELNFADQVVTQALSNITIYENGESIEFTYINYEPGESILTESVDSGNEVYSYSFGLGEGFDLTHSNLDEIDLSEPINTLQKKGLLPNPFIIWSTEENAVLKN